MGASIDGVARPSHPELHETPTTSEAFLSKKKQKDEHDPEELAAKVKGLGIPRLRRHIFLCCDQTEPKCCKRKRSLEAWDYLKRRIGELGLSEEGVYRTKANCLRVCLDGPIAVVYPDGVWYRACDPPVLERILREHILEGRPVTEYMIAERPLPVPALEPDARVRARVPGGA